MRRTRSNNDDSFAFLGFGRGPSLCQSKSTKTKKNNKTFLNSINKKFKTTWTLPLGTNIFMGFIPFDYFNSKKKFENSSCTSGVIKCPEPRPRTFILMKSSRSTKTVHLKTLKSVFLKETIFTKLNLIPPKPNTLIW